MIGFIYIKSTVVLISQLKGAVHPLVLTDQGISTPPPCFIIHNLNHVSAFILLLLCLTLAGHRLP